MKHLLVLSALTSTTCLTSVLVEGCSDSSDDTGGRRIALHTQLTIEPSAKEPFATALGWNVTLSKAMLALGGLYYFDGVSPLAWYERSSDFQFVTLFAIKPAHAHPGHYQQGNALGQMLRATGVDLFAGVTQLADGEGVTGTYRSARFTFASGTDVASAELAGYSALVEGRASKDGSDHFFRARVTLADIAKSAVEGRVDGCVFYEVEVVGDGTISVVVDPKVWFELVDFAELTPGSVESRSEFPAGSQPQIAFAQGLSQISAYKFSYSRP